MRFLVIRILLTVLAAGSLATSVSALNYLELEQMSRAGMTEDLLKTQIERANPRFEFEELEYLMERGLSGDMIEYLLRYYVSSLPDIDVPFLIRMKALKLSDEMIELMVSRYGFAKFPLTPEEIIQLKEAQLSDALIEDLIRSG